MKGRRHDGRVRAEPFEFHLRHLPSVHSMLPRWQLFFIESLVSYTHLQQ